ncbi:MAG: LCP family protein [Acidimicrobiia bacterium]|nr:LCP family protein [Acidimicrobiia bacterium]
MLPWDETVRPRPRGAGRPTRRRLWLRRGLVAAAILVAIAVLAGAATYAYVDYRYGQIAKIKVPGLSHGGGSADKPMTILLVGNNTRTGLSPSEIPQFGSPDEVAGARSDVTMLLRLDPKRGASILSIPRDLFVPLPPHSVAGSVGKIDGALNDGPEHLVEAITGDLGIPIDHYVSINFDGFQQVVSALGGIDMSFPTPVRDSFSGLHITTTGCQHLGGFQALAVVRARHLQYLDSRGRWVDDPESDLSRIRRDHAFLSTLAKTTKDKGLTNPLRANAVLGNLVHQVTVDSGMSVGTMLGLIRRYHGLNPDAAPQLTLPVTLVPQPTYHFGGGSYGSVVFPSQPADAQVIASFLGAPLVEHPPASVDVVDRSGRGAGQKVADGLSGAGFTVGSVTREPVQASPSETVVRYHPGEAASATAVLSSLAGAALVHDDAQVPAGTVEVDVGSVVKVAPPASESPSAAAPSAASHAGAPTGASPTTTTSVPTPGGQPVTPAVTPLQPFDPRSC